MCNLVIVVTVTAHCFTHFHRRVGTREKQCTFAMTTMTTAFPKRGLPPPITSQR